MLNKAPLPPCNLFTSPKLSGIFIISFFKTHISFIVDFISPITGGTSEHQCNGKNNEIDGKCLLVSLYQPLEVEKSTFCCVYENFSEIIPANDFSW